jgi:hypothetical protein
MISFLDVLGPWGADGIPVALFQVRRVVSPERTCLPIFMNVTSFQDQELPAGR